MMAYKTNKNRATKTEQRLRAILEQEITAAENDEGGDVNAASEEALDYYYGRLPKPDGEFEEDGKASPIVSTDVADMVNAVLAQLAPMLSTDCLVEFEAKGKQDEEQSRAESSAVNHIIIEENQGYVELQEAIKDALLLRNCAAKVFVEDETDVRRIPLTDAAGDPLPNEAAAVLLQPKIPQETRELDGDNVKVTTTFRKFRFRAVPVDNIVYEANAPHSDVQQLRFFAERLFYTRSELREMGFPKEVISGLPAIGDVQTGAERKRNASGQPANNAHSRDQDNILCYEAYLLIDLDGDGISERYKILYAGNTVLEYEAVDVVPYAFGTGFIVSHRMTGESLADKVIPVQFYKTQLLRNWLDNQEWINRGQWVADPTTTNFDDITSGAGIVRAKDMARPPTRMEVRDLGPSINAALTYQDKMRTEKGGAALDMMSADAQLVGETAYGIERQYAQREMLVSFMGRNLAETFIRPLYLLMHHFLRRYSNAPLELKMNGEWTQVDPRQWRKRTRCNVKAGMSAGERTHIQRTLQQLLQFQMQALQMGQNGVLADLTTIYNTITDWATYAGLDDPDSYVINPISPSAQRAAQANSQAQQQQAQAQQQLQRFLIGEQLKLEYAKLQQKAKEANDELAYKFWSDRLKSETEEMKIVATGTIDLEKVQMQGERNEAQIRRNGIAQSSNASSGENQE